LNYYCIVVLERAFYYLIVRTVPIFAVVVVLHRIFCKAAAKGKANGRWWYVKCRNWNRGRSRSNSNWAPKTSSRV